MTVVATGALSAPVPGLWHRLSLISTDGRVTGLSDADLIGQLEEVGIPRHQHGVVFVLKSWQRAGVPPDVALALWLLREQEDGHGLIYRRSTNLVEESSPAIRYIQLAAALGETRESDPTLDRVVAWLLDRQLPDGSIPLGVVLRAGETGQTARTLRSLCRLGDPELAGRATAISDYLRNTARPQPAGAAWTCYPPDQTVVTGSTSLAVTALIEHGLAGDGVVHDGLRYLLAAQDPSGGWSEVPGDRPTIQNTFQSVRAIRSGRRAGVVDAGEATAAIDHARTWFGTATGRQPPPTVVEHSFAVRTADQLGLLGAGRYERLARQLSQRRREFLDPAADMYADTEIAAIALLEASRSVDATADGRRSWQWRWQLPHPTPPFLARGPYVYELLYGVVRARWWVRWVDRLVYRRVIDRTAGLLLGAVTSVGIVSDYVVNTLSTSGSLRGGFAVSIITALVVSWFLVKVTARRSWRGALPTSAGSLVTALLLSLMFDPVEPVFPVFVSLVALRWLVIDVVSFTADSAGLLDALLPKR
jgi:hypothetical protein